MQLPLSGPPGPGTPGPGPMYQGPPPNVMVHQQSPMGGMLLPGPPGQHPSHHMHYPGVPMHHMLPGMPMGPMMPDHPGPRGPPFFSLESRIYDMNRRLLDRNIIDNESASLWWDRFVTEFFEDDATLTLSFQLDGLPNRHTIGRTLIPRYFRTIFEGGVTDLYFMIRVSVEGFQQPNTLILDCDRVTMVTSHNEPYYMQVQTDGRLLCEFAYPLLPSHMPPPDDILPRIRSWNFIIISYAELVPKNLLTNVPDPAIIEDLSKHITRQGLATQTLNYLRLCFILEPMQELMSHYRLCNNGQTVLSPRECLNRVVFHKYSMLRGPPPPVQAMMPPEEQPKPASKRRKRKGSSSGGTTTPTGPGGQQGKKKAAPSPSPAIMPSVVMPSSHVDVMVVLEPSMMGGEYGDEDERFISRLENAQFDPAAANAQMSIGSPVPPGGPPPGAMLATSMMPPLLQADRPFDPSVGWPVSAPQPPHLHHLMGVGPTSTNIGAGGNVSGPNTPQQSARTVTTPVSMQPPPPAQLTPSPSPVVGGRPPPPLTASGSQNGGSRQSTPNNNGNLAPTSF